MFTGEYYCKIDSKGRLILPVKIREKIGTQKIIATRGTNKNIEIYMEDDWNKVLEKISKLNDLKESHRKYKSFILSGATELEFDAQSRVSLPKSLVLFSNLEKEVVIVGNFYSLQIWNKQDWDNYLLSTVDNISDIMESIEE